LSQFQTGYFGIGSVLKLFSGSLPEDDDKALGNKRDPLLTSLSDSLRPQRARVTM
jgi:hypothetical protein